MKQKLLFWGILGLLGVGLAGRPNVQSAAGAPPGASESDSSSAVDTLFRSLPNHAFGVGEKLTFVIRWGPIHAGEAVMEVPEIRLYEGRKVYLLRSTAYTNRTFSTFFRVRDRVESLMDVRGLFTWHFEKHLREGKFLADIEEKFDQRHHFVVSRGDTIPVPPNVQDVLSSLYFVRTRPLTVGDPIAVANYADHKVYPLEVKILRKEEVRVRAGKFHCIVIEPILKSTGIFQQKGKLTVWLTDDTRHMPVLMKSRVLVGSFVAELKKFRLGVSK